MKRTCKLAFSGLLSGLLLSACVNITDPDKDDDYDSDGNVIVDNEGVLEDTNTGAGIYTDPGNCNFAIAQNASTTCLIRNATNPDQYEPQGCHITRPGFTWVKAIGDNLNVWVLVSNDDPHFTTVTIDQFGTTSTKYTPNLVHNRHGEIIGHRVCGYEQPLSESCPTPTNQGLPNSTQKSCLGIVAIP